MKNKKCLTNIVFVETNRYFKIDKLDNRSIDEVYLKDFDIVADMVTNNYSFLFDRSNDYVCLAISLLTPLIIFHISTESSFFLTPN